MPDRSSFCNKPPHRTPKIRILDEQNDQIRRRRESILSRSRKATNCSFGSESATSSTEKEDKNEQNWHKKLKRTSMSAPPAFAKMSSASRSDSIQSHSTKAKFFSELIVRIPARQLKRIAKAQGISSMQRETQHFVVFGVTSVNGLLRIYRSRGFFRFCWITAVTASLLLLLWQIAILIQLYFSKPTVSQVSFLLPGNGLPFPAVTICSHNPIRRQYVENMNKTVKISRRLLEYIMLSFVDVQYLMSASNTKELENADEEWNTLTKFAGPTFSVNGFFWNASATCPQMLKVCSFGGREFDCCEYTKGILTDIGKCYQLDLSDTNQPWLRRQVQAGLSNGLQIIVDAHIEQQISSLVLGTGHPFVDNFETGFRYYVHEQHSMPYLSTEGISVSPGTKVFSAVSPTNYILLPEEMWGNCTDHWPMELAEIVKDESTTEKYSSIKCKTLCHAKHFNELCGCSPFIYNIEEYYPVCTPYEAFKCLNSTVLNATSMWYNSFGMTELELDDFHQLIPSCPHCKIECRRWVYHTYNSYAQGFSQNSLMWLRRRNPQWSPGHVGSNFVSINIFYRDMVYTEYKQVQSISMTQILSDIGGNMGLFLGMSVISLIEFFTYMWKLSWLFISKKRREHMLDKKRLDEERERNLQQTVQMATQQRNTLLFPLALAGQKLPNHEIAQQQPLGAFGTVIRSISRTIQRKPTRIRPLDVVLENGDQTLKSEQKSTADNKKSQSKSQRSHSVIATFFHGINNSPFPKVSRVSSDSVERSYMKKPNLVDSIIESRLHGNAGLATSRSCTFAQSSSEEEEDNDRNEDIVKPKQQEMVELKIDLDANTVKLVGPKSGRRCSTVLPINPPSSASEKCSVYRSASTTTNQEAFLKKNIMRRRRRHKMENKSNSCRSSHPPQHLLVVPTSSPKAKMRKMAQQNAISTHKNGPEEAPNLSSIARKHSMAAKRLSEIISDCQKQS